MVYNIFRPLKEDERKDVIPIEGKRTRSILDIFLKELTKVKLTFQEKYRPFDFYSARIDFEEKVANKIESLRTTLNDVKRDAGIDFGDLTKYGDPSRFNFIRKDVLMEDKLLDGIRQPIKIGTRYHFKGKFKGNRISIQIPIYRKGDDANHMKSMEKWIDETYINPESVSKETIEDDKKEGDK